MKILMHLTVLVLLPLISFCQPNTPQSFSQTVRGRVSIPPLQEVQSTLLYNGPVQLTEQDLKTPRLIPHFCRVTVTSNIPWQVSISSSEHRIESQSGSGGVASAIFSFRKNGNTAFVNLSDVMQPIANSENNELRSTFDLDLKISATVVTPGGIYTPVLSITVSPQ